MATPHILLRSGPKNGFRQSTQQKKEEIAALGRRKKTMIARRSLEKRDCRRFIRRYRILQGDLRTSKKTRMCVVLSMPCSIPNEKPDAVSMFERCRKTESMNVSTSAGTKEIQQKHMDHISDKGNVSNSSTAWRIVAVKDALRIPDAKAAVY